MTLSFSADAVRTGFAGSAAHAVASAAPAVAMRQVAVADWDRISGDFDGISQEQTLAFTRSRWPGLDHQPFVFEQAGQIVGGVLVLVQRLPFGLSRMAITKWGPMLADETRADAGALYAAMIGALVQHFSRDRAMMLSVVPRPLADGSEYATLKELGFADGASVPHPDRYIVSLRHSEDALMASFAQKWRYHLKKSFKAELSFEPAGPERLGEFMALYAAMSARKQFPDHSAVQTLPALMAMPDGTARPDLFFVRKPDGTITAGGVIFTAGAMATYLYGATDDDALELRAGYFMHWHVMRWLVEHTRARMYDLGGTDGFQGLHQFKRGMVGTLGHVSPIPPMMHIAHHGWPRLVWSTAFAARDGVLKRRRQLIYWLDARRRKGAERD